MYIHDEQRDPLMKKIHLLRKDVRSLVENFKMYEDLEAPNMQSDLKKLKAEASQAERDFKLHEKEAVKKLDQALSDFLEGMDKE